MQQEQAEERIDRLLDAIELVKENRKQEALPILRNLIREDNNFEDAWLWMSVAVDSVDQSVICLDHVLRINPKNWGAAGALFRLRETERAQEKKRSQLRFNRDIFLLLTWMMIVGLMFAVVITFGGKLG